MIASLRIGPITNPDRLITAESISVKVLEAKLQRIYAFGQALISVKARGSDCPSGCAECSTDGTCYACIQPSMTPFLSVIDGACEAICPQGTFLSGSRCLKCHSECTTCHGLDQCASCFGDAAKVFVDGRCLSECPLGTVETIRSSEAVCIRDSDFDNLPVDPDSDGSLPIF